MVKGNTITVNEDGTATIHIDSKTYGHQRVLIDASDVEIVQAHTWRVNPADQKGAFYYVRTWGRTTEGKRSVLRLHRLLIDAPGLEVDHVNGNPLDNRRCNLRAVTAQQNQWNRVRARGYAWDKQTERWKAHIHLNDKKIHLGYFETEDEARAAYLAAKQVHHRIAA